MLWALCQELGNKDQIFIFLLYHNPIICIYIYYFPFLIPFICFSCFTGWDLDWSDEISGDNEHSSLVSAHRGNGFNISTSSMFAIGFLIDIFYQIKKTSLVWYKFYYEWVLKFSTWLFFCIYWDPPLIFLFYSAKASYTDLFLKIKINLIALINQTRSWCFVF